MAIQIGSIDKKSVDELKKILKMLRSEYAKTKNYDRKGDITIQMQNVMSKIKKAGGKKAIAKAAQSSPKEADVAAPPVKKAKKKAPAKKVVKKKVMKKVMKKKVMKKAPAKKVMKKVVAKKPPVKSASKQARLQAIADKLKKRSAPKVPPKEAQQMLNGTTKRKMAYDAKAASKTPAKKGVVRKAAKKAGKLAGKAARVAGTASTVAGLATLKGDTGPRTAAVQKRAEAKAKRDYAALMAKRKKRPEAQAPKTPPAKPYKSKPYRSQGTADIQVSEQAKRMKAKGKRIAKERSDAKAYAKESKGKLYKALKDERKATGDVRPKRRTRRAAPKSKTYKTPPSLKRQMKKTLSRPVDKSDPRRFKAVRDKETKQQTLTRLNQTMASTLTKWGYGTRVRQILSKTPQAQRQAKLLYLYRQGRKKRGMGQVGK